MASPYVVIGAAGSGSVFVEAALTLAGLDYRLENVASPVAGSGEEVGKHNPMRQVPALITPSGELITESAAILIWLAESHPEAKLGPATGDPGRAPLLRGRTFVSAAIYSLYWIRDDPSRIADDEAGKMLVRERTADRILHCWSVMDSQISPDPYLSGPTIGVLDLYVTVISRWGRRRKRFYKVAPKLAEVVRRVDAEPRLAGLWAERFPFTDGWEG